MGDTWLVLLGHWTLNRAAGLWPVDLVMKPTPHDTVIAPVGRARQSASLLALLLFAAIAVGILVLRRHRLVAVGFGHVAPIPPLRDYVTRSRCYPERFAPHGRLLHPSLPLRLLDAFIAPAFYSVNSTVDARLEAVLVFTAYSAAHQQGLRANNAASTPPEAFHHAEFLCSFPASATPTSNWTAVLRPPASTFAAHLNVIVVCVLPYDFDNFDTSVEVYFQAPKPSGQWTRMSGDPFTVCRATAVPFHGAPAAELLNRVRNEGVSFYGIATLVRDKRHLLVEWIEYALMQGAAKVIVYVQEGPVSSLDVGKTERLLGPFVEQGVVDVVPFPFVLGNGTSQVELLGGVQYSQVLSALWRYRSRLQWISFHNVDEFMVPVDGGTSVVDVLMSQDTAGDSANNPRLYTVTSKPVYLTRSKGDERFPDRGLVTEEARMRFGNRSRDVGDEKVVVRTDLVLMANMQCVLIPTDSMPPGEKDKRIDLYHYLGVDSNEPLPGSLGASEPVEDRTLNDRIGLELRRRWEYRVRGIPRYDELVERGAGQSVYKNASDILQM